jgi:nucleoside-diphosphate-sugar epimerase
MAGGYIFDVIAFICRRKLSVSSIRVRKYCATTQYDSTKAHNTGFVPPYTLQEGLERTLDFEFIHPHTDDISFITE